MTRVVDVNYLLDHQIPNVRIVSYVVTFLMVDYQKSVNTLDIITSSNFEKVILDLGLQTTPRSRFVRVETTRVWFRIRTANPTKIP